MKKNLSFKYIIIALIAFIIILIPFWLIIINSFKNLAESSAVSLSLPSEWRIAENYYQAFTEGKYIRGFLNTTYVSIISVTVIIITASLSSWIFARAKSKIIKVLYYIAISGILIPPAIITSVRILTFLNIYGTFLGLILFYIGVFQSFTIFFMTGFIKTIPRDLEDAARIDGCNNFKLFYKIIFPLLQPVIVTVSIFLILYIWNDFLWPFYILKSGQQSTLVLGLYNFYSSAYRSFNWHLIFTFVVLTSLPLILFYFFAQKYVIKGIMAGSIKQ